MTAPIRVLHVDDEPDFADLSAEFLERATDDLEVIMESSADAGLARLDNEAIDCIVSDYDMPGKNGLQFLDSVRDKHPDLPFILFTGKGSEEVASDAISAGVTDYLQKGSETEQYELLANRITNAVEKYRAVRSDRQLSELAENTNRILYIFNHDWSELCFINSAYEDIWGQSVTKLREEPADFLNGIHPDDRDMVREAMEHATGGRSTEIEYRVNADEDYGRWVRVRVEPIFDDTGAVVRVAGFANDITEEKQREQELRELKVFNQEIVEHAPIGLFRLDEDLRVIYENPQAENIIGVPDDEAESDALGTDIRDLPSVIEAGVAEKFDALADGERVTLEVTFTSIYDEEAYIQGQGIPLFDEGSFDGAVVLLEDVTERKEQEAALEREQAFIEQAVNTLDDVFYVVNKDGALDRWNDRLEEVTGYTSAEIEEMEAVDFFPADHQDRIADAIRTTFDTGDVDVEAEFRTKGGDRIPYEFTGARITGANGDVRGLVGVGRDVSARRQRRRGLERKERRYQAVFEDPNILAGLLTPDGTVLDINRTALEYIDGDLDDVSDTPFWETAWWEGSTMSRAEIQQWVDRAAAGEYVEFDAELTRQSGEQYSVRGVFRPVIEGGDVVSLVVSARDVTARKEQEQRFDAVFDDPQMLVALLDTDGTLQQVNETALSYLDVSRDDVAGQPFWTTPWWSHSTDLRRDVREWIERAADGEYVEYEREHSRSDDHLFTASGTIRPVTDSAGNVTSLIASAQDITERKERERELERYAALTQQSSDILTVVDEAGVIQYQSPSIETILGYGQPELVGDVAFEYVHPDDRETVVELFSDLIEHVGVTTERITYRMRHADGSWRWIESVGTNQTDTAIEGYVITSRDITERQQREQELEYKNEQLEEFAQILSHDIRNPLNVLIGSLELAEKTGEADHFETCERAVERIEQLIDDMLSLAQQGEQIDSRETVDIAQIASICWETVDTKDATLAVKTDQTTQADKSRLRQLLENLFRNAIEHGGQEVTITVGDLTDGFYIADDGAGFQLEDPERILTTGFSTRSDGTGIGLSIVQKIVTAHGWEFHVAESESGGARFEITGTN